MEPPVLTEGAASRLTVPLSHDGPVANLLGESVEEVADALAAANRFHKAVRVTPITLVESARRADLNLWDYATDLMRRLPIDNNAVERSIRPVALGRKNWLFAGSERGGHAAATFFTLVESARRADLNPWDYATDLLRRLPSHSIKRLEELLPDNWKINNPA